MQSSVAKSNRRLHSKCVRAFPLGQSPKIMELPDKDIKTHRAHRSRQSQQAKTRLARPGFLPSSPPPQNREHLTDASIHKKAGSRLECGGAIFVGKRHFCQDKSMTGNCPVCTLLLH